MTARTLYVIPLPSFDTSSRSGPRTHGLAERVRADVLGLAARVTSMVLDATAAVYLLGHTLVETETAGRLRRLFHIERKPEAPEPVPSKSFDVVDQASWESFPASDPPGY